MNNKNRILIFIKNMKDPSAYYRIGQYLNELEWDGRIKYISYAPDWLYKYYYDNHKGNLQFKKILLALIGIIRVSYHIIWDMLLNHSDIIVVNRQIFPRVIPFYGNGLLKLYLKRKKVYWDFDDNIIYDHEITEKEVTILEQYSDMIIVTNDYLKATIQDIYHTKVTILPTTDAVFSNIDLEKVNEQRMQCYTNHVNIIWVGTKINLTYLSHIIPLIEEAAKEISRVSEKRLFLKVICNENLKYETTTFTIENIEWTRTIAEEELMSAHIGIMPLINTEFTKGKGGFKGVQYISAGIPSILSNVGYNSQVIEDGVSGYLVIDDKDWINSLVQLSLEEDTWKQMSLAARGRWEQRFHSNENKEFWHTVLM